ncbi:MAG: hypothetical protein AAFR16_11155 [Pseudomonadota bacterium]
MTLAAVLGAADLAAARAVSAAERQALAARVAAFQAAGRAGDFKALVDFAPPRVTERLAARAGTSVPELRARLSAAMAATFRVVTLESLRMDMRRARYLQAGGGAPYALIPTETITSFPDGARVLARSETVALLDGGVWCLIRVEDPDRARLLREAYPAFREVRFPPGSVRRLN